MAKGKGKSGSKSGRAKSRNTKKKAPVQRTKASVERAAVKAPVGEAFVGLVEVMRRLRAPGGCPWDREQNHQTLRTYLIEEAYEVLEALDEKDDKKFAEEMGDLLLQIVFHSQIAAEEKRFTIEDVIGEIHGKMIRRHPHVFGTKTAKDADEVLRNWEIIKKKEKEAAGKAEKVESVLDGVPKSLPALLEGYQLTRKAARIGFDWESVDGIFAKVEEEIGELRQAVQSGRSEHVEDELGDLLFAVVNLARFLKVDPEIAAKKASAKFARRFRQMERVARQKGTTLAEVPRGEMESLWDEAKAAETESPTSKDL